MLNYGVRILGDALAVDLTLLRPMAASELPIGFPFVAASARF